MTKKLKQMVFVSLLAFMVSSSNVYAMQEEDEGPDGPPGAPISDWVPLLVVLGMVVAYKWQRKNNKATYQVDQQQPFK